MKSCGETTVWLGGTRMSLRATCEKGIIIDTFAKGFACPHHEGEEEEELAALRERSDIYEFGRFDV